VPLHVVEQAPALQALPARQSASVPQPQVPPLRQAEPFLPAQEVQAPPADPHAPEAVPAWQVVPSQQPPLHCPAPEQLVVHLLALQALPLGQSVEVEHPHALPTHALPFGFPAQSTHAVADPHVVDDVPATHLPIEPPQQNPAPQPPPSQSAVQALPEHVGVSPEHVAQARPALPHAADDLPDTQVLVVSQHPPLHGSPPAHDVEQTPFAVSHASPTGQSFSVVQP
jgi:hypothetical protein